MALGTLLTLIINSPSYNCNVQNNNNDDNGRFNQIQTTIAFLQLSRLLPSIDKLISPGASNSKTQNLDSSNEELPPPSTLHEQQSLEEDIRATLRLWFPEQNDSTSAEKPIRRSSSDVPTHGESERVGSSKDNKNTSPPDLSLELFWLLLSSLYRISHLRIVTLR